MDDGRFTNLAFQYSLPSLQLSPQQELPSYGISEGRWGSTHSQHCEGKLGVHFTNKYSVPKPSLHRDCTQKLLTQETNLNSWGLTKESRSCINLKKEPIKKYGPKVLNKALRKEGFLWCFLFLIRTSASSGPSPTWFSMWLDFFIYVTSSFLEEWNQPLETTDKENVVAQSVQHCSDICKSAPLPALLLSTARLSTRSRCAQG